MDVYRPGLARDHRGVIPPSDPATAMVYTCPMHPEVKSDTLAPCPKCGMALEPAVPPTPVAAKTEYVCPKL